MYKVVDRNKNGQRKKKWKKESVGLSNQDESIVLDQVKKTYQPVTDDIIVLDMTKKIDKMSWRPLRLRYKFSDPFRRYSDTPSTDYS